MTGERLQIWTDGACGKSNHGGWAFVLHHPLNPFLSLERSGPVPNTTSQRMELTALLMALQFIREGRGWSSFPISIHTDSSYLKNCFTQGWHRTWASNGWVNSKGNPVANQDLWELLIPLVTSRTPKWVKVKGHRGIELNERCDQLAVTARKSLETSMKEEIGTQ